MKIFKTILFSVLMVIPSAVLSQEYTDFDTNSDGMMDMNEFSSGYQDSFGQWDRNLDGMVDDQEFYDTTFDRLDTNADEYLDANEWNRGYDGLYGEYLGTRDPAQFDVDRDEIISRDEYYTGFRNSDFFNSYDTNNDGDIDNDELNENVFRYWDLNQDENIDENEYERFRSFYLDTENQE